MPSGVVTYLHVRGTWALIHFILDFQIPIGLNIFSIDWHLDQLFCNENINYTT